MDDETLILGPEYDRKLRRQVTRALKRLGARRKNGSWGVGGSQDVFREIWTLNGREITLASETYVGLSVTGPAKVVRRLQAKPARGASAVSFWLFAALLIAMAATAWVVWG